MRMAYEISGQSDIDKKNKLARPGSDDHGSTTTDARDAEQRADAVDPDTNPDTLKAANQ
jgi:hypothetical protein